MGDFKVTWYGHGTTKLVSINGFKILVDPFLNGNPACPPELRNDRDVDLILITHGHGDHFGDTLMILKESHAMAMCVVEMASYLHGKGFSQSRIIGFNIGGSVEFNGLRVMMTNAVHSSVLLEGNRPLEVGPAVGFLITLEDQRKVYFAGDTDIFSEMQILGELCKPTLAVLPIDGYYNMCPRAAAKAVQMLQCDAVLPVHHSTFAVLWGKPNMLKQEMAELGLSDVKIHMVSPGQVITI